MSKFIIRSDYQSQIRTEILSVITGGDESVLEAAELAAIDELKSYINDRYDVAVMLSPVYDWAIGDTYKADDRVILPIPPFKWNKDDVFANGSIVCNEITAGSPIAVVQNSPAANTAFNNATYFVRIGAIGELYSAKKDVTAQTLINDQTFWLKGDSRSALALRYLVDIIIYEIHCRINPRNIPEHRINRRDDAVKFLKAAGDPRSNVNPNWPERKFEDNKGTDITFGGRPKLTHYF